MLDKLAQVEQRFEEINEKLCQPDVVSDMELYKKYMQEIKHLTPVVEKFREHKKALADIEKLNATAEVLILGRNRRDIDSFICREIQVVDYKRILHKDFPKMQLKYSTVHGSKGLESDFVVLISGEDADNGFPNKTEDDAVLDLLLGKKNSYEYAEERRLFYVALTSTKSIVYLLSDKEKSSQYTAAY